MGGWVMSSSRGSRRAGLYWENGTGKYTCNRRKREEAQSTVAFKCSRNSNPHSYSYMVHLGGTLITLLNLDNVLVLSEHRERVQLEDYSSMFPKHTCFFSTGVARQRRRKEAVKKTSTSQRKITGAFTLLFFTPSLSAKDLEKVWLCSNMKCVAKWGILSVSLFMTVFAASLSPFSKYTTVSPK